MYSVCNWIHFIFKLFLQNLPNIYPLWVLQHLLRMDEFIFHFYYSLFDCDKSQKVEKCFNKVKTIFYHLWYKGLWIIYHHFLKLGCKSIWNAKMRNWILQKVLFQGFGEFQSCTFIPKCYFQMAIGLMFLIPSLITIISLAFTWHFIRKTTNYVKETGIG